MPKISAPTIAAHRAQVLDRILDAVAVLTRDQGIDEISMTDVATVSGITRTALYNYFPDKPALLLAFTERVTADFVRRCREELPRDAPAVQRLAGFVDFQLEAVVEHPHPAAAELGASLGPQAYQKLADHVAPMHRLLVEILQQGTDSGEFEPVPAEPTAKLLLALIGSQRLPLVRGEVRLDEARSLVTEFALRALGVDRERAAAAARPA
ncbi:TetR/AcrR family transcriptional regulator [Thermobifida cellulosilytica]|uniref:TetR family transcriptional regulator n=1 Tax=Thermobifida cellulosilytica TB100 TaxID=665004 RepID=A0A147KMD9_THECS|nr:TetR/AcrR family transcriptional regulator [Thermobifida cellulosilytica]KUP98423.1 TetR family transcriptional regulator [Thermobifida cellulosilytica TB100]